MKNWIFGVLLCTSTSGLLGQTKISDAVFGDLYGRQIGPAKMSGRISCLDALNSDGNVVWIGAASGGVWKSKNAGITCKPVFDDYTQSIGAIRIDQNHPDTVWVGTGEPWTRNSVSVGTGVYKTTDGGEKWTCMGLENTERIGRICIHPTNPDIVYVAALGPLWADSEHRGLYQTTDGGKTWKKTLAGPNLSTGCSDVFIDPRDANIIYAALWDFRRTAYDFRSGGEGSGLYKSTDGGTTWKKIHSGFPAETFGRIAVSCSPVAPYYVYALVESEKTALYRSTDRGENWTKVNDQLSVAERPFYFSNIVADPIEGERVYKPGFITAVSNDGGKVFTGITVEGGAWHPDHHALWVNPKDNRHMYVGTDGGVYVTNDKGNTWRPVQNLPVSQFYHVSFDMATPYNVYGGLQDNGSWSGPSQKPGGIQNSDWKTIGYGDGFNCYADKLDNAIVYWQYQGGRIYRTNKLTGESKYIKPLADEKSGDLRYNWNTPVVFSKTNNTIYVGAQYLYRSKNRGDSWERISPDLTTNDPNRQKQEESGGITPDNSTAENNTTIISICESPLDENIIWVGTDDGNVQLTTNGGASWAKLNTNITGLPPLAWISSIDADNFDKNAAYLTVDAHRNGDIKPYVFYTNDLGKTWISLVTESIKGYAHNIKQDLINPNMLFLGTEFGLFISLDKGKEWVQFKNKVPQVGIYEIQIHPREHDLILGTHGRGIIIIDDITPLRNLKPDMLGEELVFLPNKPYQFPVGGIVQDFPGDQEFVGSNPTTNALVTYYMSKRHVFGEIYLEMYDAKGNFIKKLPAGNRKGINRVQIDTRMLPPKVPVSVNILGEAVVGPEIQPGNYTIKLIKGDKTFSTVLNIAENPAYTHSTGDKEMRNETLMKAYNMLEHLAYLDHQILEIQKQADQLADSLTNKKAATLCKKLAGNMEMMHKDIVSTQQGEGAIVGQIRLREKIGEIYGALTSYKGAPNNSQVTALSVYEKEMQAIETQLQTIVNNEVKQINTACAKQGLNMSIILTGKDTFMNRQ
jgi:photosystem II stability/assembly factor-like uncharacterized protein